MDTSDSALTPLAATVANADRVFPTLTPTQVARIATHGRRRSTMRGEVLVEVGDRAVPFFVVVTGEVEALRPSATGDTLIVRLQTGQFSGEGNMLSGRRAIAPVLFRIPDGWIAASSWTRTASRKRGRISRPTSSRKRSGRWHDRRICSKPAGPASLRWETCAAATSSA